MKKSRALECFISFFTVADCVADDQDTFIHIWWKFFQDEWSSLLRKQLLTCALVSWRQMMINIVNK